MLHFINGGQREQISSKICTVSDYTRNPMENSILLPGNFPGQKERVVALFLVLLADKHMVHGTSFSPRLWLPSQRFLEIGILTAHPASSGLLCYIASVRCYIFLKCLIWVIASVSPLPLPCIYHLGPLDAKWALYCWASPSAFIFILRKDLTVQLRLVSCSPSSCLRTWSAVLLGICHHKVISFTSILYVCQWPVIRGLE